MSAAAGIITIIVITFVVIRTVSFIVWNWKSGNKSGSVMVFFVCAASVALPLYVAFFRA